MSKEQTENCKQRFKAIETFLRRVAFNLGNTASQTEVKIISCIPIDVTDLQRKICQLEKELEDARKKVKIECPAVVPAPPCVHTALCHSRSFNAKGDDLKSDVNCNATSRCDSNYTFCNNSTSRYRDYSLCSFTSLGEPSHACLSDHMIDSHSDNHCCEPDRGCKKFFSKIKHKNKKKCNTQFVYYAQTDERSPFESFSYSDDVTSKNVHKHPKERLALSRTFLADVFQKQYKPEPIMKVFSNFSNFSAPVCRDVATSSSSWKCTCDSEVCSCCCDPFHETRRFKYRNDNVTTVSAKNRYYDSTHYDMIPVRETPSKHRNKVEVAKKKISKRPVAGKGRPSIPAEDRLQKFRVPHVMVNYHQMVPSKRLTYHNERPKVKHMVSKIRSRKQMVINDMAKRRTVLRPTQPKVASRRSSKICFVDYGPVYAKPQEREPKQRDAAVMPSNVNVIKHDNPCPANSRTIKERADPPPEPTIEQPIEPAPVLEVKTSLDKTEMTLNQIKAILQSVLLEVKINSKFGKPTETSKKDAVVQNGVSHNNMYGDSHLLQSVTYSPYSMSPYSPSCSRHMCTNCYRSSNVNKYNNNVKKAASAATNTDQGQERNNETESLIKEIYDSIALNLQMPQKDNNFKNNIHPLGNIHADSINKVNIKVNNGVSEIFRNTTLNDSSATRNTDTTFVSKPTSNDASVGSHFAMTHQAEAGRAETSDMESSSNKELDAQRITNIEESDEQSDSVDDDQELEQSSTDSESAVRETNKPKSKFESKRKKGLFNKMFQMFKPKEKAKGNKEVEVEVDSESESDTDDYQTVYSHRAIPPRMKNGVTLRSRPHSKVAHRRKHQQRKSKSPEKARRSPYMEQEHRRYWNEKLMFHEDEYNKYVTSSGKTREGGARGGPSVFAQNFEARGAFVDNVIQQNPPTNNMPSQEYSDYRGNGVHPDGLSNYSRVANNFYYSNGYNPLQHQGIWINCAGTANNPNPNANAKTCIITPRVYKPTHRVTSSKGLTWLKKRSRQLSSGCGEQWKKFILEN